MRLRRSKALNETVELNITAFLNLMVILVPFLLITAVFSRITVLELTLPPAMTADTEDEQTQIQLQLQMLIYPDTLELRDANLGVIRRFAVADDAIDWAQVTELLIAIKSRFPDETGIALLLDPAVPYRRLIEVMDRVRSTPVVQVGSLVEVELFPSIAIGDAPARDAESATDEVSLDGLQLQIQQEAPP